MTRFYVVEEHIRFIKLIKRNETVPILCFSVFRIYIESGYIHTHATRISTFPKKKYRRRDVKMRQRAPFGGVGSLYFTLQIPCFTIRHVSISVGICQMGLRLIFSVIAILKGFIYVCIKVEIRSFFLII